MPDIYQTLSIVAGTMKCNARCPDCIAKMTTPKSMYTPYSYPDVDWSNFDIAANKAIAGQAKGVLFTSKGESTLFPAQIHDYLKYLNKDRYALLAVKEIQTNALVFHDPSFQKDDWLHKWYDEHLRVMSVSVVDTRDEVNRVFYTPHAASYPALEKTVDMLHDAGYTIRLSVTLMKNRIQTPADLDRAVDFCKSAGIEQLTARPIRKPIPSECHDEKTWKFVAENELTPQEELAIVQHIKDSKAPVLEKLAHGARVYEYRGQNLCLSDCITHDPDAAEGHRQIIFYSNGIIAHDWTHQSNLVLGMGRHARQWVKDRRKRAK